MEKVYVVTGHLDDFADVLYVSSSMQNAEKYILSEFKKEFKEKMEFGQIASYIDPMCEKYREYQPVDYEKNLHRTHYSVMEMIIDDKIFSIEDF